MNAPSTKPRDFAALRRLALRVELSTRAALRADSAGKASHARHYQIGAQSDALQAEFIARRHAGLDTRHNQAAYNALDFAGVRA